MVKEKLQMKRVSSVDSSGGSTNTRGNLSRISTLPPVLPNTSRNNLAPLGPVRAPVNNNNEDPPRRVLPILPNISSVTNITTSNRSPNGRSPTNRSPNNRSPGNRSPTNRSPSNRTPGNRSPGNKSSRRRNRITSPRDDIPIVMEGQVINRDSIPSIPLVSAGGVSNNGISDNGISLPPVPNLSNNKNRIPPVLPPVMPASRLPSNLPSDLPTELPTELPSSLPSSDLPISSEELNINDLPTSNLPLIDSLDEEEVTSPVITAASPEFEVMEEDDNLSGSPEPIYNINTDVSEQIDQNDTSDDNNADTEEDINDDTNNDDINESPVDNNEGDNIDTNEDNTDIVDEGNSDIVDEGNTDIVDEGNSDIVDDEDNTDIVDEGNSDTDDKEDTGSNISTVVSIPNSPVTLNSPTESHDEPLINEDLSILNIKKSPDNPSPKLESPSDGRLIDAPLPTSEIQIQTSPVISTPVNVPISNNTNMNNRTKPLPKTSNLPARTSSPPNKPVPTPPSNRSKTNPTRTNPNLPTKSRTSQISRLTQPKTQPKSQPKTQRNIPTPPTKPATNNNKTKEKTRTKVNPIPRTPAKPTPKTKPKQSTVPRTVLPQTVTINTNPNVRPIPNYGNMSEVEKARWHADFNIKFGILREAYPQFNIPHYDDTVSLSVKHNHYERYVRQIHVDNSVGTYKFYLMLLFIGIELFCVKILGLDFGGYTINQLTMLNKYERLLIELGEKSYSSTGSSWPVEVRIVMMSLFNALVFLVVKLAAAYMPVLGDFIQQIVNSFMTQEDPSDLIKKAQKAAMHGGNQPEGVPNVPEKAGGFDFGSLLNGIGGLFGGPKPKKGRASRTPTFTE